MAGEIQAAIRSNLRYCHSPSHATNPMISMKVNATSAPSWCATIASEEMSGRPTIIAWAASPLMYAGSVARAIRYSTSRLTCFRWSLRRTNDITNTPRPTTVPMVGT